MNFTVLGPFPLSTTNDPRMIERNFPSFWDNIVEKGHVGLDAACGCYIFSVSRRGGAPRPWYVGMTTTSFKTEATSEPKRAVFNEAYAICRHQGVPNLFFIPLLTPTGKFARVGLNANVIQWLETFLIGFGLKRNPKLLNISKTKIIKNIVVPGIIRSPMGPPTIHVKKMKKMLGLSATKKPKS